MVQSNKEEIQPMNKSERPTSEQTVLTIGNGIGGLAAAIVLQEVGFDVEVNERERGAAYAEKYDIECPILSDPYRTAHEEYGLLGFMRRFTGSETIYEKC